MSIIIKKRKQYNKKKLIQRIIILIIIYFTSFFALYIFWHPKSETETTASQKQTQTVYANEGEKAIAEGNYAIAIEYFLRKIDENPEDYISMTNLAIGYKKVNEIDKAKFYLYKSLELAPNYTQNYIEFADIYIAKQNYDLAENAINAIPLKNSKDFIAKANLLLKLATIEDDVADKIVHYNIALNYLKKYDIDEYNKQSDIVIKILFQLADKNIAQKDYISAQNIYSKILKYKNNCYIRNILALRYKNISKDELALQNITAAVQFAETQEEKRLTKESIITLRYYFEKKSDDKSVNALIELLNLLDESKILIDEKYMPIAIKEDSFAFINDKQKYYPQIKFSVLNKSEDSIPKLLAKMEIYIHSKQIISTETIEIVNDKKPLEPNKQTELNTIEIHDTINAKKLNKYNIALSLSTDGTNWNLYRLYKK